MKIEYWVVGVGKWLPQAKMETLPMDFQRPVLANCRTIQEATKELEEYKKEGYKHVDVCKVAYEWMGE